MGLQARFTQLTTNKIQPTLPTCQCCLHTLKLCHTEYHSPSITHCPIRSCKQKYVSTFMGPGQPAIALPIHFVYLNAFNRKLCKQLTLTKKNLEMRQQDVKQNSYLKIVLLKSFSSKAVVYRDVLHLLHYINEL